MKYIQTTTWALFHNHDWLDHNQQVSGGGSLQSTLSASMGNRTWRRVRVKLPCRSNTCWLSNRWMYIMNQILGQSKFLKHRISPILSENQSCRQLCLQPARLFHQTVPSQTHSLVHFELNLTCLIILREAVPSAWPSRTILRGSVSLASQTFRGKIHFYIFVQLKNVLFLRVRHLF